MYMEEAGLATGLLFINGIDQAQGKLIRPMM